MQGQMMHCPLRIIDILAHAAEAFAHEGITSAREEGDIHTQTYPQTLARVSQLAHALTDMGVKLGDRIATLAWNGYRHFELYYAISGMGAVCHTLNPRLPDEQLIYIINHAQDRMIFVDPSNLPLLARIRDKLPADLQIITLADQAEGLCYEDLIKPHPDTFNWLTLPEDTAAGLCYTSGTTGNPKGALYSQRSTVLHALMVPFQQNVSFQQGRKVLPVVPLFHVNAWGLPYTATLSGMSFVMPGRHMDGASLFDLMDREHVFSAWGVPTVWAGLWAEIQARDRLPTGFTDLVVGGSAAPRSMIADYEALGVTVSQAWGMTEMSPIGTKGVLPPQMDDADKETQIDAKVGAGRRLFGLNFKIVNDDGTALPHDGQAMGQLYVRGNTVISSYFDNASATADNFDQDGWFGTGDVATLDPQGRLIIQDRSKDLVKSGGEWISSIDLENAAVSHPALRACAVIAVPHPKWDERPVLVAVAEGTDHPTLQDIHAHMGQFAKWQLPDDVIYVDALPLTATGKISKLTLRQTFADYIHPDLRGTS